MKSFLFLSFIGLFSMATAQCNEAAQANCARSGHYCVPGSGSNTCNTLLPVGHNCVISGNPSWYACKSKRCMVKYFKDCEPKSCKINGLAKCWIPKQGSKCTTYACA
jgi:hypothetical protein